MSCTHRGAIYTRTLICSKMSWWHCLSSTPIVALAIDNCTCMSCQCNTQYGQWHLHSMSIMSWTIRHIYPFYMQVYIVSYLSHRWCEQLTSWCIQCTQRIPNNRRPMGPTYKYNTWYWDKHMYRLCCNIQKHYGESYSCSWY